MWIRDARMAKFTPDKQDLCKSLLLTMYGLLNIGFKRVVRVAVIIITVRIL